ncbi:MAG: 50S ribosomal protein L29 [Candidatus Diapherotrites archaeon]|nr:50S ribosomal protein L29 [Candidatus Diapherotrites archaeon]
MAVLKAKEIRKMSPKEREKKLQEIKAELSKERAAVASGTQPENPGRIKELRRAIARILTIEKEMEVEVKK